MKSILFAFLAPSLAGAANLSSYNIDAKGITTSGISSGAYMAVQLDVAYSGTFSGVGSIAGGIYGCAEGNALRALNVCMADSGEIISQVYVDKAAARAAGGEIDPVENLRGHKVYVLASDSDKTNRPPAGDKLLEFFRAFTRPELIATDRPRDMAHGFPTENEGVSCTAGGPPYLLKCGFDGAGAILRQMYGPLKPRGAQKPAHLKKFSQAGFGPAQTPLLPEAWVYVPGECASGAECRLHVALHGCGMSSTFAGDQFARLAGYNEWAETNRIIVLYPQAKESAAVNPKGCWDWWGYSGPSHALRSGPQMQAIKQMVDRLRGQASGTPAKLNL